MADLIGLPKIFHPDFSHPLKKPVGSVILNKGHDLYKGTVGYWLLKDGPDDWDNEFTSTPTNIDFSKGVATYNGTDSKIVVSDQDGLDGFSECTFHVELDFIENTVNDQTIVAKHANSGADRTYQLAITPSNIPIFAVATTSSTVGLQDAISSVSLVSGNRYLLSGRWDTVSQKGHIYIDGVLVGTSVGTIDGIMDVNTNPLTIGCRFKTLYDEFTRGAIRLVHILEVAQTDEQILRYGQTPYQVLDPASPVYLPISAPVSAGITMLPLPRIFHPGFTAPSVIPTSDFTLDKGHNLYENLKFALVGGKDGDIVDLKTGIVATGGLAAGKALTTAALVNFSVDSSLDNILPITVMMRVKIKTGASSNERIVHYEGGGRDWHVTLASGSSKDIIFFRDGSGGDAIANTPNQIITSNIYADISVSWNGLSGGNVNLTVDGQTTTNAATGSFPSDAGGNIRLGAGGSFDYEYLYILNEELTQNQIAAFHKDPYQLVKPATPIYYPVGASGGGGPGPNIVGTFSHTLGASVVTSNVIQQLIQNMNNPMGDFTGGFTSSITVPGSSNVTLDNLVEANTGKLTLTSNLSNTLVDNSFAATSKQVVPATMAEALDNLSFAHGTPKLSITGTLATNLSDVIDAATSQMAQVGASNFNLAMMSQTNTGTLTITGSQNFGLGDVTFANSLDGRLIGAFAATLGNLTFNHTVLQRMTGTVSSTLAGGASGQSGNQTITTTVDKELLNALASVTSELIMQSTLSASMNDVLSSATSKATLVGTLSRVLSDITSINGLGNQSVGSITKVLDGITSVIDTNLKSNGTLISQLENGTATNTSGQKTQGALNASLEDYSSALSSMLKLVGGISSTLIDVKLILSIEGVLGTLPVTDLMYFNSISTGWLASSLMKVYNQIVDGGAYGVKDLPQEMIVNNKITGRYEWNVKFQSGTLLTATTFQEFTFEFAKAVSLGERLPGNTHTLRESYLITWMPLTFSSVWRVPFNI